MSIFTSRHGVTCQKTWIFSNTAVNTANLRFLYPKICKVCNKHVLDSTLGHVLLCYRDTVREPSAYFVWVEVKNGDIKGSRKLTRLTKSALNNPWPCIEQLAVVTKQTHAHKCVPLSYTECPTRYRTRHFFNNSNTNEDIATEFEQEYVRCVRNEEECVCSVCL